MMQHHFLFTDGSDVVEIHACGTATTEGFAKLDKELVEHPRWTAGMRVMCDFRRLDLQDMSAQETRVSSEIFRGLSDEFGKARFAFVMNTDVDYGMARMFEMITLHGLMLDIKVFRSVPEAWQWLVGNPTSAPRGPERVKEPAE